MRVVIGAAVVAAMALSACGRGDETPAGPVAGQALVGTPGPDHLWSTPGGDSFDGGEGYDYARYDTATASVTVDLANPSQNTGEAAGDTYASIQGIAGSPFDDVISGDDESNDLHGAATGNDTISGRGGADALTGEVGDDTLDGGADADTYSGGAGADSFRFARGEADGDTVSDFEGAGAQGGDLIVLVGFGEGATFTRGSGGRWQVRTADGAAEMITITGGDAITTSDYRFE